MSSTEESSRQHMDEEKASLHDGPSTTTPNATANATASEKTEDGGGAPAHQQQPYPQQPVATADNGPPDSGLWAWLQVAGAFGVFFNSWGLLNTFGIFQTYYESGQLFHASSSNISWIGSIQAYLVLLGGLISGPLYDRGYLRALICTGAFLVVFGHMMLSLINAYWQAVLAQGLCIGLGAGLMFTPAVSVLQTYFRAKLGLAVGLAAAGSSLGGIIYPIVFYRLIDDIDYPWTVRTIGFIAMATLTAPILFLRQRVTPVRPRAIIDATMFTDWPFMLFLLAALVGFTGLYVMLFYISYYAAETGATSAAMAFYTVPILNAASVFGRTLPNWLSDKTGPLNILIPGSMACGVLVLCMQAVHDLAGEVVIALFFGFFSGVFVALPPVAVVSLTADKSKIGTRIGMSFALSGIGTLIGGPGGGAILGKTEGDLHWTQTWVFGGVMLLGSAALMLVLRLWRTGFKVAAKA